MRFTNTKLNNFAKDPAVVNFKGKYFLYYTVMYAEKNIIGIGIATSNDLENWEEKGEIPFEFDYEQTGIGAPAAIVLNDKIHLFYQTYGKWENDAICHAISDDGFNFERNKDNPIYRPNNNWCCGRAIDADVCIFDNKLYMYFATRDHNMKIQKISGAYASLDSDFSKTAWTALADQSLLIPEMAWEGECIEAPAVIVNKNKMFMFYGGSYNCTPQQIGCAGSDDGILFQRVFEKPFLACGKEGEWNCCESGHPYVFKDNDSRIYLFYQGTADNGATWYLSKVEIKFDENNIPYIV